MGSHRWRSVLALLATTGMAATALDAQVVCGPPPSPTGRLPYKAVGLSLSDLKTRLSDRFARWPKFTIEQKDTPDTVLHQTTRRLPPEEPGGEPEEVTITVPVSNPQENLTKYSLELDMARLALSTSEVSSLFSTANRLQTHINRAADPLSGNRLDYFLRSWEVDGVAKFFSAFSVTGAVGDRPSATPTDRKELDQIETLSIKFDPDRWLPTPQDLSNAAAGLDAYAKAYKPGNLGNNLPGAATLDPGNPADLTTVKKYAHRSRILSLLLPSVEFKSEDLFDFLQSGSVFFPLEEESLETLTFVWDFSRAFDRQRERLGVFALAETLRALQSAGPQIDQLTIAQLANIGGPVVVGTNIRIDLLASGGVAPLSWSLVHPPSGANPDCVAAGTPKETAFPGVRLLAGRLLIGTTTAGAPAAPGCDFELAVEDAIGQTHRLLCNVL